jgi:hypothetical protein
MVETGLMVAGEQPSSRRPLLASEGDVARARDELLSEMKVTKGCRFNASKRLERRDKRMITITAFASVYVILLTVLPLFFHVGEILGNAVTATVIVFSLIILASSLLQYSNNDPVRAEQHHRCGLEVNALRRALRATDNCSMTVIAEYSKRYDDIIQKYGLNHDDIDFDKYKIEHPLEYPKSDTVAGTKEAAKRVGREQRWAEFAVSAMSALAAALAAAGLAAASPFVERIMDMIRTWLQKP